MHSHDTLVSSLRIYFCFFANLFYIILYKGCHKVGTCMKVISVALRTVDNDKITECFILTLLSVTSDLARLLLAGVLSIGPKVHAFKPGRDDRFLRAIKARSTPPFGGEVKPSAPYRKILQHVKERCVV
jgi:hypothetical protein